MEDSWEYWLSHLGMSDHDGATTTTTSAGSSLSFEEIISFKGHQFCYNNNNNNNNNNNVDDEGKKEEKKILKRRGVENNKNDELEGNNKNNNDNNNNDEEKSRGGTKKGRSSSEAMEHIMSERKRRQQMAERFIALSATIPGLKKIDKASVLQEAINYVKQLQERIAELEQEETNNKKKKNKKSTKSFISVTKSQSCEEDDDEEEEEEVVVPEVEARELEKEVLIRIHCEKRNGIMINLLALLENNHLSVASSSILPFGNSALNIIIIAQKTEEFNLAVNDLVKNLKKYLLKFMRCSNINCGPC